MSGRWLALVILLAVASGAIGAGAAFLLRQSDNTPQTPNRVVVAETATPTDSDAEPQQQSPTQLGTRSASAQTQQSLSTQPAQSEAAQPQDEPQAVVQDAEPQQEAVETATDDARQQPIQPEAETEQPIPADYATLTPDLLTQGEAFALTVESADATAIAATVAGRSWNLTQAAAGLWWGVIAIPRDADTGATAVIIDLYGPAGAWLRSLSESVVVLASTAPFEEIILGGAGAALDPAAVQRDVDVRFVEHTAVTGPPRWTEPWILPVEGEVSGVFGAKRSYDGVVGDEWHHGHDIAAHHGDPIVAPAPGTVVWTGELVLHGMGVIIDHGAGVYSGYWHMSLITVREGMEVAPGDWLGNIGTTGLSTGPHLHWEVIVQGIDVDPIQWTGETQPLIPSPSARG